MAQDDEPWFTDKPKILDRRRKREYLKRKKSKKWKDLNAQFLEEVSLAKES